jgi:hypothetical protein
MSHPQAVLDKTATHIIDIVPPLTPSKAEFFNFDMCRKPWPFPDKFFDFSYCSNTLEDIRDPMVDHPVHRHPVY